MENKSKFVSVPLIVSFLFLLSCNSKKDDISVGSLAKVRIELQGSSYSGAGTLGDGKKMSNQVNSSPLSVQRRTLRFNDDLTLLMELTPVKHTVAQLKATTRAAVEENDLTAGVKYKVAVFNSGGTYISERDYVRGSEANAEDLKLNGGQTYTFVAYSINSNTDLPTMEFTDNSAKTLSTAHLSGIQGSSDLMYFQKVMEIAADQDNYLGIDLQHKFSQITATVDASATGYMISAINAGFDSHYPTSDIQLADGSITRTGAASDVQISSFSGLNTAVVTGSPTIINGGATNASFKISSIQIGSVTKTNLSGITGLAISPGIKYNLKITVTPNDIYLTQQGQSAARIGGLVWMRHNLGANTATDPDKSPSTTDLNGNYYQFGRKAVVATVNTAPGAISGWNTTAAADGSWNSGTETSPIKTANDPCPTGYRLPLKAEFQKLMDNTDYSNTGTWATSGTQNTIGAAKVLTSKTNSNVKLTFPANGYRNAKQGILYWRGGSGNYWSASTKTNDQVMFGFYENSVTLYGGVPSDPDFFAKTTGAPIRCIAE